MKASVGVLTQCEHIHQMVCSCAENNAWDSHQDREGARVDEKQEMWWRLENEVKKLLQQSGCVKLNLLLVCCANDLI